jgi:hypothetical protein
VDCERFDTIIGGLNPALFAKMPSVFVTVEIGNWTSSKLTQGPSKKTRRTGKNRAVLHVLPDRRVHAARRDPV